MRHLKTIWLSSGLLVGLGGILSACAAQDNSPYPDTNPTLYQQKNLDDEIYRDRRD